MAALAWVDEAAPKFRVRHLFPEAAIIEMGVVEKRLGSTHRPPSEAALLGGVIDLFCRQAGDEIGDQVIDDVRRARRNDRRILVFGIPEIAGHAIGVQRKSANSPIYFGVSRPAASAQTYVPSLARNWVRGVGPAA